MVFIVNFLSTDQSSFHSGKLDRQRKRGVGEFLPRSVDARPGIVPSSHCGTRYNLCLFGPFLHMVCLLMCLLLLVRSRVAALLRCCVAALLRCCVVVLLCCLVFRRECIDVVSIEAQRERRENVRKFVARRFGVCVFVCSTVQVWCSDVVLLFVVLVLFF